MYLRCVPLDDEEDWRNALESGKEKELRETQMEKHPSLQYPFLGTPEQATMHIMHQTFPHRPLLALEIRRKFNTWKLFRLPFILIPNPSHKTTGEHTSQMFNDSAFGYLHTLDRPTKKRTTFDLEQYYSETGLVILGPSEVRYAWKYNDLKPRIYYALGGEAYFASRYIAMILDSLSREFEATDPNIRYSFHRFGTIDFEKEIFMIYDYASFTSALVDFKAFMHELGLFCLGRKIWIFDTFLGIVERDVGEIILEYNAICNNDPEFSIHRLESLDGNVAKVILNHRVAGMLGVYGNIVGSTILHGLATTMIVGSESRANTIGDDAGVKIDTTDISLNQAKECLNIIGTIVDEKFEVWDEDGRYLEESAAWHYTKRPLEVSHNIIMQKWMPDFPILSNILGIVDNQHTVQPKSFDERRNLCIVQTCRLFDSMTRQLSLVNELDIQTVLDLLRRVYTKMRLPPGGSFPSVYIRKDIGTSRSNYPSSCLMVPRLCEESIRDGWFQVLKNSRDESMIVRVPVTDAPDPLPIEMKEGDTFLSRGSKILGLLQGIHVVSKEALYEELLLTDEVVARIEDVLFRRSVPLYRYTVLRDYPPWLSYSLVKV
jgi:hypothetical protein